MQLLSDSLPCVLALGLLAGCASSGELESLPDGGGTDAPILGAPRDESGHGGAEPWIVIQLPSQDVHGLVEYTNAVSGYLKVVLAQAEPPWVESAVMGWMGEMNPIVRMIDADEDGRRDVTGDVDTFGVVSQGMQQIPDALFFGGEENRGVRVLPGVVGYDLLGRVFLQQWAEAPVVLGGEEAAFVRLPDLPSPGALSPCYDSVDDDGDGWTDDLDPDCRGGGPLLEQGLGTATCNDGIDNDGDGLSDRQDPGCERGHDLSELPSCEDDLDDDGDGWTDEQDPDCLAPGAGEHGQGASGCNDGVDGDLDGWVDGLDPDCAGGALGAE